MMSLSLACAPGDLAIAAELAMLLASTRRGCAYSEVSGRTRPAASSPAPPPICAGRSPSRVYDRDLGVSPKSGEREQNLLSGAPVQPTAWLPSQRFACSDVEFVNKERRRWVRVERPTTFKVDSAHGMMADSMDRAARSWLLDWQHHVPPPPALGVGCRS